MAFTQQDAAEMQIPLPLLNQWEEWMQELWAQSLDLYAKRGYDLKNGVNEIRIAQNYTVKIEFVNAAYLEIVATHWTLDRATELATVRVVGKKEDLCSFVHCIVINHLKNA